MAAKDCIGPQCAEQMKLFMTPGEIVDKMTASPDLRSDGNRFETMDELKSRKLGESKVAGNSPDMMGRPMQQSLYDSIKERGLDIGHVNLTTDTAGRTAVEDGQHRMIAGADADKELGRETLIPWNKITHNQSMGKWVEPGSEVFKPTLLPKSDGPTESVV
jgi:hypothetical protein